MLPPIPPIQNVNEVIEKGGTEVVPIQNVKQETIHQPQVVQQPYFPNVDCQDASGNVGSVTNIEVQNIEGDTDKVNSNNNIIHAFTQCCRLDIKDVNESRRKQNSKESAGFYLLSSGLNCAQIVGGCLVCIGVAFFLVYSILGAISTGITISSMSDSFSSDALNTMYIPMFVSLIISSVILVCIGFCLCCFCCGSTGGMIGNCVTNEGFRSEKSKSLSGIVSGLFGCNLACVGISGVCVFILLIPLLVVTVITIEAGFSQFQTGFAFYIIPFFIFFFCLVCCFTIPCCGISIMGLIKNFKMNNQLQSNHFCSSEVKLEHDIHSTKKIFGFSSIYSVLKVIGGIILFTINVILISVFIPIYISREVNLYNSYSSYSNYTFSTEKIVELVLIIITIVGIGISFIFNLISQCADCCGCGVLSCLNRKGHKLSGLSSFPTSCSVVLQIIFVLLFSIFELILDGWSVFNIIFNSMMSSYSTEVQISHIFWSIFGGLILYSIQVILILLFVVPSWAFSCSLSLRSLFLSFSNAESNNNKETILKETTTSNQF